MRKTPFEDCARYLEGGQDLPDDLRALCWAVQAVHQKGERAPEESVDPGGIAGDPTVLVVGAMSATDDTPSYLNPAGFAGDSNAREVGVMSTGNRYTQGVRDRAVQMVLDHEKEYDSQWAKDRQFKGPTASRDS